MDADLTVLPDAPVCVKLFGIIMLSPPDTYVGGELEINSSTMDRSLLGSRELGDMTVFPSSPHRRSEVEAGERIALVALAYGPPFR